MPATQMKTIFAIGEVFLFLFIVAFATRLLNLPVKLNLGAPYSSRPSTAGTWGL